MKKCYRFLVTSFISLALIIYLGFLGFLLALALWKIAFLGLISLISHYSIYRYTYHLIPDRDLSLQETLQGFYEHFRKKSTLFSFGLMLGLTACGYWWHVSISTTYFFISASNGGPCKSN
ncbi:hypothetical protein ACVR0A_02160 [Streptococcus downei]|uniref:Uncharacterized protein n=1 Tax=Streptococcus downei MFe28 TaxID=764290 RepID=A0A380JGJ3_STRDO|nr:hypothetical protein [Streptococcus downei]SUN36500.1 Uncharacterised protein [Streptococcus downei MFe28]